MKTWFYLLLIVVLQWYWELFLPHQVVALSVDLTSDAQDVENTLDQVWWIFKLHFLSSSKWKSLKTTEVSHQLFYGDYFWLAIFFEKPSMACYSIVQK